MELNLQELETKLTSHLQKTEAMAKQLVVESSDVAKKQLETLNKEITDAKVTLGAIQEQMKAIQSSHVQGAKEEEKKSPFDLGAYVGGIMKAKLGDPNPWKDCGPERERVTEYLKVRAADNTAQDGTLGAYVITPEVTDKIIDLTIARMPTMELGPTVVRGLVGELPVPTVTGRPTASWVGENGAPTATGFTLGQKILRPKKLAAFSKQSNRLAYMSRGVSDKIIKQQLTNAMALALEEAYINGTGNNYQPKGILQESGLTTSTVSLTQSRFRIDNAATMMLDLENANENGQCGMLMKPTVRSGMKRERIIQYSGQAPATGAPILASNLLMTNEILESQVGCKIRTSTLVPYDSGSTTLSPVICGDWSLFWIGIWRDMWIKTSQEATDAAGNSAFLNDEMFIVAFHEVDTLLMRASGFTKKTGCSTLESDWVA